MPRSIIHKQKRKFFALVSVSLCLSLPPSDISQNDAELLKEQQQSLLQLQETAEVCCVEHVAQKARREAEAKAKEEAEKQRIAEEKKKLEYIQQLQDKMLEEEATLLEGAEGSQVAGSKHKEFTTGDEEGQWPSKKTKEKQQKKYYRSAAVKMGGTNPCKRCVSTGQDCLVYSSR